MITPPEEIVADFIKQSIQLHETYAPAIKEADRYRKLDIEDPMRSNLMDEHTWKIKEYRKKQKGLCEKYGARITDHNFSENQYQSPCCYQGHEVINIRQESAKKVRVFTKTSIRTYNKKMVFTLELKNDQWCLVKQYRINGKKEEAMWW